MTTTVSVDRKATLIGAFSYFLWGLFPIYWKLFSGVSSPEILAHRMVWTFPFYLGLFFLSRGEWKKLWKASHHDWFLAATSSLLLAINWGIYIYAVRSGRVVEGSLAYFLNPLLNVAVGVAFFREPFPWPLRFAVFFAVLGVAVRMTLAAEFPWIALILATTFCAYGVAKKRTRVAATAGSAMEGAVGFLPALAAVVFFRNAAPEAASSTTWLLFVGAGVVTGFPLFLFSYAAQRVPYSLLGVLQFTAPTLQFLLGVFVYNEAFGPSDLLSFSLIWFGVLLYAGVQLGRVWKQRPGRQRKAPTPVQPTPEG